MVQPFNPAPFIPPTLEQGGGGVGVALDASQLPPPAPSPNTQGLPRQAPPQAPLTADLAHHSAIGKLVKTIMGTDSTFETQPDGSVKEVPVPQKPGQLFRGMLLSGILGAGTQAHGFGEGFAKGASSTVERHMDNRDKKRAEEVQNQGLRMKKQQMSDEHAKAAAEVEHSKVATLHTLYVLNHVPKDNLDRMNAGAAAAQRETEAAQGKAPQVIINGKDINGVVGNAKDWESAILKDPKLAMSPDQEHVRSVITSYNVPDGATVKDGEWVDAKGSPIDMHNFATIRVYDVPLDSLNKIQQMSGAEANSVIGSEPDKPFFDPSAKLNLSLSDLYKMKGGAARESLEAAQGQAAIAKAKAEEAAANKASKQIQAAIDHEQRDDVKAVYEGSKAIMDSLEKQISEEQKSTEPDQNKISQLQIQLSAARQQMVSLSDQLNPRLAAAGKKVQENQVASLPKPKQKGEVATAEVGKAYLDTYGPQAHDKLLAAGYTLPPPKASSSTGMTPEEAAGRAAGGGNPSPTPMSSSRPYDADPNKPGAGPF